MRKPRSSTRDDFDRVKDAAQELRAENRKLRKENSSLRKQLNRAVANGVEWDEEEEGNQEDSLPQESKETCSKCKSQNVKKLRAGIFNITVCEDCGSKKRTQAKN